MEKEWTEDTVMEREKREKEKPTVGRIAN